MNKAEELILLTLVEGKYDDPESIIKMTLDRIQSLAVANRVKIEPDLETIKTKLLSYVKHKGTCPVWGKPHAGCVLTHHESASSFHDQYKETVKAFAGLLTKAKAKNPWLDVKAMVEPLAKLQVKDNKKPETEGVQTSYLQGGLDPNEGKIKDSTIRDTPKSGYDLSVKDYGTTQIMLNKTIPNFNGGKFPDYPDDSIVKTIKKEMGAMLSNKVQRDSRGKIVDDIFDKGLFTLKKVEESKTTLYTNSGKAESWINTKVVKSFKHEGADVEIRFFEHSKKYSWETRMKEYINPRSDYKPHNSIEEAEKAAKQDIDDYNKVMKK